jgi:hypothetical protein
LIRRIAKAREIPLTKISVCYEAGGCGMWIARMFMKMPLPPNLWVNRGSIRREAA